MGRLTDYEAIFDRLVEDVDYEGEFNSEDDKTNIRDALYELDNLKQLEEQIGMPLLIMFDILKSRENIFCIDGDFVASDKPNSIEHCEDYFKLTYWDDIVTCDFEVAINEFNKTWFLTREEAEKKLEELKNG